MISSLHFSYEAITYWLGCWIPSPKVPGSKPQGGSKVDSAFYPSKVDQMSIRNSLGLTNKTVSLYCMLCIYICYVSVETS